ncbi:hypothetical protein CDO52_21650 [Nocardiopsis gilva YIM 90087]|uniref:Hint domain-containing protein n=1 Tax=Nocardiopsis gilva YIM 90087 TaxID=1235441 RepID=A0A223SA98_9ACTN|nr:hypothetical protein CDO52_21650 [Nocardiopsis gilva YIM 90087]
MAILAALMSSGIVGTVASGVQSATEGLFGDPGADGGSSPNGGGSGSSDSGSEGNGSDGGSGPDSATDGAPDSSSPPGAGHDEDEADDSDDRGASEGSDSKDEAADKESGQGGGTKAAPSTGSGGLLDDLLDKGDRALRGAGKAAENAVNDGIEDIKDAKESVEDLIDDPEKWAKDKKDELEQTAEDVRDRAENDPVGLARDFFFSDEAQEKWRNGDKAGAAGMGIVENAEGLIPIWGWNKKKERLDELAEAASKDKSGDGRESTETSTHELAGGDSKPDRGKRDEDEDKQGEGGTRDEDDKQSDDEEKGENGGSCRTNSFAPGTPVLLGDGSLSPIEDIAVGDEVWAFDPLTGEEGPRPVTALIDGEGTKVLVDITVDDEDGGSGTVTATASHPFWAPKLAKWVDAIDLEPGTWLRTSAGIWVQVVAVTQHTVADQQVHNLSVAGIHTYYVVGGTKRLLVHNDGSCLTQQALDEAFEKSNTPAKLEHVIDPPKHGFEDIVRNSGGREQALRRIINSLGEEADLPEAGRFQVNRVIDGETVTIRGAMVNGVPRLGTAYIASKFPGR